MKALIRAQVSEQYNAFCRLSRRDKITYVGLLLLGFPSMIAAIIGLQLLFDSRPWIAYSAGALLFIH